MSDPAPNATPPAPEYGKMPVLTMIGGGLFLLLFLFLVFLMFSFNKRFYAPKEELTERIKQREEQKQGDEAVLLNYGKTDAPGVYRVPIKKAMELVIRERNEEGKSTR